MHAKTEKFNFALNFLLYIPVKLIPACSTVALIAYLYRVLPEGHYTNYSVALTCSIMLVQLGTGWVGNSFIYFLTLADDKDALLANSLRLLIQITPFVIFIAAIVTSFFGAEDSFWIVVFLSASQIFYFFFSSVLQARFRIREQLWITCLQVTLQFSVIFLAFKYISVDYRSALVALAIGYGFGGFYAYIKLRPIVLAPVSQTLFKKDVRKLYDYGVALIPWMLGVLVLANADKLLVSYLDLQLSDSYISTKDLFVGASGLISMPLLMLIHPVIINSFNINRRFDYIIISESLRYLIVCFSLLWVFLHVLGFELFFFFAEKKSTVSNATLFFSYLSVFFACASIYLQKRFEVHRKWSVLAWYSVLSALFSIALVAIGSFWFGILGASAGAAVGQAAYCCIASRGLMKRTKFIKSTWRLFLLIGSAYAILFQARSFLGATVGQSPNWYGIGAWISVFSIVAGSFVIFFVRWDRFNIGKNN